MPGFLRLLIFFAALSAAIPAAGGEPLRNGDLVFIVNPHGQGKAIQLATKSKYTHVGIVFIEDGKTMVYHAVEPVSRNTIEEFAAMAIDGKYAVRRLKDQSVLDQATVAKMLAMARSLLGLHYDYGFHWSDEELYCSEFVWKLYEAAAGVHIGEPRPMKTFDLSHPVVKDIMHRRYGKKVPLDEPMISPGDMYDSELLER